LRKEREEVFAKLKNDGVPVDVIARVYGISIEEAQAL
jgi:hypothetical protein